MIARPIPSVLVVRVGASCHHRNEPMVTAILLLAVNLFVRAIERELAGIDIAIPAMV